MKKILTLLTIAGLLDAAYLTYHHYVGNTLACVAVNGCQFVTTSEYAVIYGIPLALIGLFYYISLLIGELIYFKTGINFFLYLCLTLCGTGTLVYLYLIHVQAGILHAFCFWCLISAGITFTITGILIYVVISKRLTT